MKRKSTLILLLVLFILLSWAVYSGKRPPAEPGKDPGSRVFKTTPAMVREIAVYNDSGYARLVLSEGQWKVIGKDTLGADPAKVAAFLGELLAVHYIRKLEDGLRDFSPFGVKELSRFVLLQYVDGQHDTLAVGLPTPGGSRYVRLNSEPRVMTISNRMADLLQTRPSYWEMRRIVSDRSADIVHIGIQNRNGQMVLEYDSLSFVWWIRSPVECRADDARVRSLLGRIVNTEWVGSTGLFEQAGSRAILRTRNGKETRFAFFTTRSGECATRKAGEEIARQMPVAFCETMAKPWRFYRSRCMVAQPFLPTEVKALNLTTGQNTIVLQQDGAGEWTMVSPFAGKKADVGSMDELLQKIGRLCADSLYEQRPVWGKAPAEQKSLQLGITKARGGLERLVFEAHQGDRILGISKGLFYSLSLADLDGIWEEPETFASP